MRKVVLAATSAVVLATSAVSSAVPASAHPALLLPAIIAAGVGGVGLGAAAGAASAAQETPAIVPSPGFESYYAPFGPPSMVQPGCHPARERVAGTWQRVEVCPY
jgi:hypothetical protein